MKAKFKQERVNNNKCQPSEVTFPSSGRPPSASTLPPPPPPPPPSSNLALPISFPLPYTIY